MPFLIIIELFLCLGLFSLSAESATQEDFQTWVNATATGTFYKKNKIPTHFRYWLEGQERLGDSTTHFTQTLLRPGLGYALTSNLSLWLGYAWVDTGYPLTRYPFKENRIWEQLLWVKTTPRYVFTSRTRMEQRFLETTSRTALRARQLVKISLPLKTHKNFSLVSSDEIFWHKNNFIGRNSDGFDQNRFFIGLGYRINAKVVTEFGYMNQYIRRFGVPNFLANIASINFFLSL